MDKKFVAVIFFLLVGAFLIGKYSDDVLQLGAPKVFINTAPTSTNQVLSFAFGTTSTTYDYGTSTFVVYGSTTIQTGLADSERAFDIMNSASTSVFRVDTVNSSTTAYGTFNTGSLSAGVITVTSCTGCSGGVDIPGESWTFVDDTIDFLRAGTTTLMGIGVYGSSTIDQLSVQTHLSASTSAQFPTLSVTDWTSGAFVMGGGTGYATPLALTTNGQVFIGDGSGAPTAANITGTANELTVTDGAGSITLDVPNDFRTQSIMLSASSTIQALQVQDTLQASTTSTFAGLYINAAGELRVPAGTAPTIATAGDIAIDTTNGQLVYFNAQENVISSTSAMSFVVGSTTRSASANGSGFAIATATWQVMKNDDPITLTELSCDLDNNSATTTVNISSGTATTTSYEISGPDSTRNGGALTTNNTFTAKQRVYFTAGSTSGTPHELSCTIKYVKTRQ